MAITQNLFINRTRRSVAAQTFYTWKRKNVIRSKPAAVFNPNTVLQQGQRARISAAATIWYSVKNASTRGFYQVSKGKSAYNAFTQVNLNSGAIAAISGSAVVDYSKLLVSQGSVTNLQLLSAEIVVYSAPNWECTLTWLIDNIPAAQLNYSLSIAIYNQTQDIWFTYPSATLVSSTGDAVTGNTGIAAGDTCYVYYFITSPQLRDESNSSVLQLIASS